MSYTSVMQLFPSFWLSTSKKKLTFTPKSICVFSHSLINYTCIISNNILYIIRQKIEVENG